MQLHKPLVVVSDLDAIIIDLIRPWLGWYNRAHNDTVTIDDVKSYKIETFTKKSKNMFDFFIDHENYSSCPVLPGAAEGLRALHDAGHDVVIATATAGQTAHLKWGLVHKAAPWLHENDVLVGSRKELIKADVFIDDAPKNIVKYRNAWPEAHILTIAYPYNQDCKTVVNCFAHDHNDTQAAWNEMTDYVLDLAEHRKTLG